MLQHNDDKRKGDKMLMAAIELSIPSGAKTYIMETTTEQMRSALLLYPSIANNIISHGKAAELLGMHKAELIELYGNLGIPYLDMTDEEFDEEVNTVKKLAGKNI